MQKAVKGARSSLVAAFPAIAAPLVAAQRMVKDAAEIERMAAAAALGVRLFEHIVGFMRPGIAENAVAAELEYRARLWGAEAMSFPTIVASGARSAMPHGTASEAKLPRRGFVTLDFGVILNGYCSDMTRTVHLGRATAREREAYDAVLAAQENAVAAVSAGVKAGDVDEAARSVLREAKLAEYFTHSTGHGVGLEIHESPRIAMAQQALLTKGMVITIEPGIYIPGAFGLRIEDTVVVERRGCRVLTPATKAWIELDCRSCFPDTVFGQGLWCVLFLDGKTAPSVWLGIGMVRKTAEAQRTKRLGSMNPEEIAELKQLIEFLKENNIGEFDLERGDLKVRLKFAGAAPPADLRSWRIWRPQRRRPTAELSAGSGGACASGGRAAPAAASPAPAAAPADDEAGLHIVKSPIVGTFYESPSPGSPAFVKTGDPVEVGQVLCIMEAMKLMNEIESDAAGEIVKRFVTNGQPVEYGQKLFAMRPRDSVTPSFTSGREGNACFGKS